MPLQADTRYDNGFRPWQSHEEYLTTLSLDAAWGMTPGQIRAIRPPLPRTPLLPSRFGYREEQIGIRDIVRLDDIYGPARVDYSQCQSGYSGTSFPALGVM